MRWTSLAALCLCLLFCGCPDMKEQPRYDALEGHAPVGPPPGTVPAIAPEQAPPLGRELIERGRERFNIYCAPCHDSTGHGHGVIVEHGFPQPPSLHIQRLRETSDEHLWSVITNGAGAMYPYADRVSPRDRWAIVHYLRVLQLQYEDQP
ncbi:MAG: cytochrome c [Candidatus Eremiobacteraeota bacterium]|nr:cytochrome c [Candidatus Eremiobacteraeota bacterium]